MPTIYALFYRNMLSINFYRPCAFSYLTLATFTDHLSRPPPNSCSGSYFSLLHSIHTHIQRPINSICFSQGLQIIIQSPKETQFPLISFLLSLMVSPAIKPTVLALLLFGLIFCFVQSSWFYTPFRDLSINNCIYKHYVYYITKK